MATSGGILPIEKFNADVENVAERWLRWKENFEFYSSALNVSTHDKRKRDLLLYAGGTDLQTLYKTISFPLDAQGVSNPSFQDVIQAFDTYYNPKRNITFERHLFRRIVQRQDESMDGYLTRLKEGVQYCEYAAFTSDFLKDQFIEGCYDDKLRQRLLDADTLTLDKLMSMARSFQTSRQHASTMRSHNTLCTAEQIHHVSQGKEQQKRKTPKQRQGNGDIICYRCGKPNHMAKECNVAKDQRCRKCGRVGHFAIMCKTKPGAYESKGFKNNSHKVSCLETTNVEPVLEDDYIFAVRHQSDVGGTVYLSINGKFVSFVVDTAATISVINSKEFDRVKSDNDILKSTSVKALPYTRLEPISLLGQCILPVKIENEVYGINFQIVKGDYPCLLGKQDCLKYGAVTFHPMRKICSIRAESVSDIVNRHSNLFEGIGKLKGIQVDIELDPQVVPIVQPMRRVPFHVNSMVNVEVERLLDMDIIEEVKGSTPWLTPIVPVERKEKNAVRLCLDMRKPNEAVIKHKYPIPLVDEVLQELEGATVITELDFNLGYHQIELNEKSREITTFGTRKGIYRYKRLFFGLSTAPEIFQQALQQVLQGLKGVRHISDNVLVFGKNDTEHNERLEKVFQRLEEYNLTLNKGKCQFAMPYLKYMGYLVSHKGVMLAQDKVDHVLKSRPPTTVTELRSWLGLINFCSKFIYNVADLTAPLRELLKKEWDWTEVQQKAFDMLKAEVAKATLLTFYRTDREIELVVDAGPMGLGAVLTQKQTDGLYAPVAFASKVLTSTEQKYSQTEKEALAVVWACEKFHLYLYGTKFVILTDHKPLEILYSPKSRPSARLERWLLRLQPYDYVIKHVKGVNNVADSLSRLTVPNVKESVSSLENVAEAYVNYVTDAAVPKSVTLSEIREETSTDAEMRVVVTALRTNVWSKELAHYAKIKTELTFANGILLKGTRIVIPTSLRNRILSIAHEAHLGIVKMKSLLRSKVWWFKMNDDVEDLAKRCLACQVQGQAEKPEPLVMTKLNEPWTDLALDICGPFNTGDYIVVLIDYMTKFPEVLVTKTITSDAIISWLETIFARYGYCQSIVTDNGPQFISDKFRVYLSDRDIKHRTVIPYWPQANGQVERLNKVFLKTFRALYAEGKTWNTGVVDFLRVYRTTPHVSTSVAPATLMFGREVRTKIPSMNPQVEIKETTRRAKENDIRLKAYNKTYGDVKRNAKPNALKIGDLVLVKQRRKHKLMSRFKPSVGMVVQTCGNFVQVRFKNGTEIKRPLTHVKRYAGDSTNIDCSESDDDTYTYDVEGNDHVNQAPVVEPVVESGEHMRLGRPQRLVRRPAYLQDYICT